MPDKRVEDDVELQVVKAAEPFEVFFRREFPKMVAVAYAVSGIRWAAEELAQEAFLRAHRSWEKISDYASVEQILSWLSDPASRLAHTQVPKHIDFGPSLPEARRTRRPRRRQRHLTALPARPGPENE